MNCSDPNPIHEFDQKAADLEFEYLMNQVEQAPPIESSRPKLITARLDGMFERVVDSWRGPVKQADGDPGDCTGA